MAALPNSSDASSKAAILFFSADGNPVPKASVILEWPVPEDHCLGVQESEEEKPTPPPNNQPPPPNKIHPKHKSGHVRPRQGLSGPLSRDIAILSL